MRHEGKIQIKHNSEVWDLTNCLDISDIPEMKKARIRKF